MGTWEHRAIFEGNKGTREQGPPPGRPSEKAAKSESNESRYFLNFTVRHRGVARIFQGGGGGHTVSHPEPRYLSDCLVNIHAVFY